MSLFNALNTGITGMGTNGLTMSVVGDNISNLNTVGFKGSTAEFQDLILQRLGGGRGQLGNGAFTQKVSQVFGQGSLENSALGSDMAIDGKGFFVVSNEQGRFFTRAGQFRQDAEGFLSTFDGSRLQGYTLDASGALTTSVGDLQIPTDPISGVATTELTTTANLQATNELAASPGAAAGLAAITEAASFASSATVTDSLGRTHDVTLAFFHTGSGSWSFEAYVDGADTGAPAGEATLVGNGTLTFDGDGNLDPASATAGIAVTFDGANAQTIEFDFGIDSTTDSGSLTQYAGESSVLDLAANGRASGSLSNWDIAADGTITGVYSNGETRTLGQVALANFRAEGNLDRVGHNLWTETRESGAAVIGTADSGGRGVVHGYALEMSNVDLENQFVRMIQGQKGYQASARVVSSVDELLQELMQIV
ncbi:MAG: flagellar hook protein FlgE [Proteobacteria bacterium]|nr:flagellar hook protein FlgE [Pseudomonadota bacterium]